ncbi:hypothetical protein KVV02_005258, partial [Mortierella alpina]
MFSVPSIFHLAHPIQVLILFSTDYVSPTKDTMKACFTAILLVSLQYLASVQAQDVSGSPTTASSRATVTATTTGIVAPSLPTFVNTPGLQVSTPYSGMSIIQDTALSIAATLAGQRPMSSINISVAKKDGSSNTTIVDIRSGAILRLSQIWNVTATQYPVGEYVVSHRIF